MVAMKDVVEFFICLDINPLSTTSYTNLPVRRKQYVLIKELLQENY